MTPTATPASASAITLLRTLQASAPTWSSSPCAGLKRSRCVLQREEQPGGVGGQQHDATSADIVSRSVGKRSSASVGLGSEPPITSSKTAGMISATEASSSISDCALRGRRVELLALALEAADEHRRAHHQQDVAEDRADQRRLDDLCSPSRSAKKAMISSGALPNVTLSRPPMPGPERAASSSVARPISAAVGITPSAEVTKTIDADACPSSSATAIGMNGTRKYGHPSRSAEIAAG